MNSCKEEETKDLQSRLTFYLIAGRNKMEKAEAGISLIFPTSYFSSCFILELVVYNI